ncbi:helix-turn-helix transcriptional regulator, partial [Morganella morganii]
TTRSFASYVNVSQQQLSRYERGVNKIDVCFLFRLCVYFNIKPDFFFEDVFLEMGCVDNNNYISDSGALYD